MAKSINLAPDRDPWERQPGESELQFSRFVIFRKLGEERTLNDALEIINETSKKTVTKGSLHQLSFIYRWTERTQAFDEKEKKRDAARRSRLIREKTDRQLRIANSLNSAALKGLASLNPAKLAAVDVTRMLSLAADMERKALGEPTERVAISGPTGGPVQVEDLTRLTPDQRKYRLSQIATELARRAGRDPGDNDSDDDDEVIED